MRNWLILLVLVISAASFACSEDTKPATPLETFKTYTKAIKKKDITAMKLLLSRETLKLHEQEARAQGITVDDVVKRETLFNENQTTVEFRNEKIEGDKATLEVKDSMGFWQKVFFLFEDGEWKIDKKSSADQLMREIEEENHKMDEEFNTNRPFNEPVDTPTPPFDAANSNRASSN
jgi:hypothetical protein